MNEGTVTIFYETKGFGFISNDEHKKIFVHYSWIVSDGFKALNEGDKVEFDLYEGPKGLQAHNVKRK